MYDHELLVAHAWFVSRLFIGLVVAALCGVGFTAAMFAYSLLL